MFPGLGVQHREMGQKGIKTKVYIPPEAVARLKDKISAATDPRTHQDSVNSKILALNRITGGWCWYYQYTSRAATTFFKVEYETFWKMAHWLGRKFQLPMTEVIRKYRNQQAGTFATQEYQLARAEDFPTKTWKERFIKPNPYTTQGMITREELPSETYWTGYEPRPGMADLRLAALQRDEYLCQECEKQVTPRTAEVDHIRPVRRFKRPVDANNLDNLQTLCIECHRKKTEHDRRMESPVR